MKTILLLLSVLISSAAFADGMRCNNKVVKSGDYKYVVVAKCGAPASTSLLSSAENHAGNPKVEILVFQQAGERLAKILRFENDVLVSVAYETNSQ